MADLIEVVTSSSTSGYNGAALLSGPSTNRDPLSEILDRQAGVCALGGLTVEQTASEISPLV